VKAIGGYFELELPDKSEYHENAIRVNSGRNAFGVILKAIGYKKVYLPYYFCDVLLKPLEEMGLEYSFYSIDERLEPIFDFSTLNSDSVILYINYFGLKDKYVEHLVRDCKNCIIDNSQAFFYKTKNVIDAFYSPRKFFGVPDGGYLYCKSRNKHQLDPDISHSNMSHLLLRLDMTAEDGYAAFMENEEKFNSQPLKGMSKLSRSVLSSIDYDRVAGIRIENYNYLKSRLAKYNHVEFSLEGNCVPLVFPFLNKDDKLKQKLAQHKIYTATYWPNVLKNVNETSVEFNMVRNVVYLPIDQRWNRTDMDRIINVIISG
jgi:hypothetical protein